MKWSVRDVVGFSNFKIPARMYKSDFELQVNLVEHTNCIDDDVQSIR